MQDQSPPNSKFFIWLTLLGRPWTSDRLQRYQLQSSGYCDLCSQAVESISHLLLFSRSLIQIAHAGRLPASYSTG
jgi:hypothetical protein